MTVPIIRKTLPAAYEALAIETGGDDCRIEIADRRWSTRTLCRLVLHEYGRLAGWNPRPGDEYVASGGAVDVRHSRKRRSIMFPRRNGYRYPSCRPDRIRRAGRG